MYKLLICGLGNIGYRHFQAALKCQLNLEIHLVDPLIKKKQEQLTKENNGLFIIHFYSKLSDYLKDSKQTDFLISAVTADFQLSIAKELKKARHKVVHYIIEKPAAQSLANLQIMKGILPKKSYVNLVHIYWEGFTYLKSELNKRKGPIQFMMMGKNWGLACNGLHYVELFRELTGVKKIQATSGSITKTSFPHKRGKKFAEYDGLLSFTNEKGDTLILSSTFDHDPNFSQTGLIMDQEQKPLYFFNEHSEKVVNLEESQEHTFPTVYISQSTTEILQDLAQSKNIKIPLFNECLDSHKAFIGLLAKLIHKKTVPFT